jgi:hypothetical protein
VQTIGSECIRLVERHRDIVDSGWWDLYKYDMAMKGGKNDECAKRNAMITSLAFV